MSFVDKSVLCLALAAALIGGPALGASGDAWLTDEPDFLKVDEAFQLSTSAADDGSLLAMWRIADGYYLYRHRFDFQLRDAAGLQLGAPEIPPGKTKHDEYFGDVEVYYHEAQARLPVSGSAAAVEVGVTYQGCADLGLCYPPETKWVALRLGGGGGAVAADPPPVEQTEEQTLAGLLGGASLATALAVFFLAGIGLAFTPCVLPMVPILSSIIVRDAGRKAAPGTEPDASKPSRLRAATLSLSYVCGMAGTYAVLGVLMGTFGARVNLQAALQSPVVLTTFAAVFVALALSMFGFYELQLPAPIRDRLSGLSDASATRGRGSRHLSVAVMGSLSSLVVSPCVSAPLAGALIYISTTGDAVLGGLALLALGLGMGVPLLAIGASGGHLLPRAGAWMNAVKAVFGVLLLGVAIWLLERVVPGPVALGLWAGLAIGTGVYLGALDFSPRQGWAQLWKAAGAMGFVYGVLLLIGAASGAEDPLRPLGPLLSTRAGSEADGAQRLEWATVAGLDGVGAAVAAASARQQPVLLDLYADWCISCKVMERNVFPRPEVAQRLRRFQLLRVDVTANTPEDQALMDRFGLFGPPSLVFFSPGGAPLDRYTVQGELNAEGLTAHLDRVLAANGARSIEIAARN